jgi:hypothetical protein
MTARPPRIPTILNVTPTAALLPKKPEAAPTLEVGPTETVEPGSIDRVPDNPDVKETGLLTNVVVGLLATLDVAPTVELKKLSSFCIKVQQRQANIPDGPR